MSTDKFLTLYYGQTPDGVRGMLPSSVGPYAIDLRVQTG